MRNFDLGEVSRLDADGIDPIDDQPDPDDDQDCEDDLCDDDDLEEEDEDAEQDFRRHDDGVSDLRDCLTIFKERRDR